MFLQKKNKRIARFNQHQRNFKNPYFENKKKEPFNWGFLVNSLFYFSLSVFTGLLFYVFLYSSLFQIKDIEFVGNETIDSYTLKTYYYSYLEENKGLFLAEDNVLFMDIRALSDFILANNNFVQFVDVLKNGRNLLTIKIQEKEIAGYWKSGNDLYSFDTNGKVINILNENGGLVNKQQEFKDGKYYGSINMAVLAKYPMIIDYRYNNLLANDDIPLDKEKTVMIMKIFDFVKKHNLFMINSFSFSDEIYQNLILKSLDDYLIYFNLLNEEELNKSLERLAAFLKQNIDSATLANLEYIDLRMSEKVFYK